MTNFTVNLRGKTAIVTGGGSGIGRAIALGLAAAGANVTVNDLNPDSVDKVADEIIANGGQSLAVQGDVSNRFQASGIIEKTRAKFDRVDILVNAAGVFHAREFTKTDEWDWRRQLDVNLTGTFFFTQLLSRVMIDEQINGTIINMSNSAWNTSIQSGVGYVASKAGVIGLTHQTARELGEHSIRVNAVCTSNIEGDDAPMKEQNILKRIGTPEDVANAVLFLCSDAALFITGQIIYVDGGII